MALPTLHYFYSNVTSYTGLNYLASALNLDMIILYCPHVK